MVRAIQSHTMDKINSGIFLRILCLVIRAVKLFSIVFLSRLSLFLMRFLSCMVTQGQYFFRDSEFPIQGMLLIKVEKTDVDLRPIS